MGCVGIAVRWTMRVLALPLLFEAAIAQTPTPVAAPILPRTAEGHPDLQGVWEFRWRTWLVRPPGAPAAVDAAGAETMINRQIAGFRALPGNGNPEIDLDLTTLVRIGGEYRTSLIVDPPDGQLPWLEEKRPPSAAFTAAAQDAIVTDPEQRAPPERCIGRQAFPAIPIPSSNYVQIVQPPGAVVMVPEALDMPRRLAPGKPGNADVRSRWESDTLVVESRNFPSGMEFTQPGTLVGFSPATTVVETFKPISVDEILYRFTVTDPTLYSRPWTVETVWIRSKHSIFEYACHEGNYALTNILLAGRMREMRQSGR